MNNLCKPCPEPKEFIPVELPDQICAPCPVPPERPNLLPTTRTETVEIDCLYDALRAMSTRFFCKVPPRGCK